MALIQDADLKPMAQKLGCAASEVVKPNDTGQAQGITGVLKCETGSMGYILIRTKTPQQAEAAMLKTYKDLEEGRGPFVKGSNWAALASKNGQHDKPTMDEAKAVQSKLGGTVEMSH